jgi:hypothetical protein
MKHLNLKTSELKVYKKAYRGLVEYISYPHTTELRKNNNIGKIGIHGAMNIDHKYSVMSGFHNSVSPWLIANINNIQVISAVDNMLADDSITLLELENYTDIANHADHFRLFQDLIERGLAFGESVLPSYLYSEFIKKYPELSRY